MRINNGDDIDLKSIHWKWTIFFVIIFLIIAICDRIYFTEKNSKILQKVFNSLDIATRGITQEKTIRKDYNPTVIVWYKYHENIAENFTTILNNLEAQKDWHKVPTDKMESFDYVKVEYCNQDIIVSVMIFDDVKLYDRATLSIQSEWSSGSYCYENYKKQHS